MLVTLLGISMLVKLLQPKNAYEPMLVNCELSPNVTLVKLLQLENASLPMLVTPLGISMLVKLLQPENAESPILSPPVIITSFKLVGTGTV